MSLLEAVEHLLESPMRPASTGCDFCVGELDISVPSASVCPWCQYDVDERGNGHHPLTCPHFQLQKAAERERAKLKPPLPPPAAVVLCGHTVAGIPCNRPAGHPGLCAYQPTLTGGASVADG